MNSPTLLMALLLAASTVLSANQQPVETGVLLALPFSMARCQPYFRFVGSTLPGGDGYTSCASGKEQASLARQSRQP